MRRKEAMHNVVNNKEAGLIIIIIIIISWSFLYNPNNLGKENSFNVKGGVVV